MSACGGSLRGSALPPPARSRPPLTRCPSSSPPPPQPCRPPTTRPWACSPPRSTSATPGPPRTATGSARRALGDLALAARFHDVGKIGIPDDVLLASRDLGAEDWDVMRTHVVRGERLFLATAREDAGRVARLIRHHHEAVDGSGYPDGLRGAQIPLECRVLSLVDAFDAMTSQRPYRAPMPVRDAMRRLGDAVGHQLDADVFAVFE